jgi:nucleolar protein 15
MDNYLLFGHILKCKTVPTEQIHENIWKGANKRFKKVPWSKLEGRKLKMGMDRERWSKRIENEKKRRQNKIDKLKALGYEFEPPALKEIEDVPEKQLMAAPETAELNVATAKSAEESMGSPPKEPMTKDIKRKAKGPVLDAKAPSMDAIASKDPVKGMSDKVRRSKKSRKSTKQ